MFFRSSHRTSPHEQCNFIVKMLIFQLFQCQVVYQLCITQIAFFCEVSHICTGLFSLLIKDLSVFEHNFFILRCRCFMPLLNFIISKYIFFKCQKADLGIYGTSISRYAQFLASFLLNISSTFLAVCLLYCTEDSA